MSEELPEVQANPAGTMPYYTSLRSISTTFSNMVVFVVRALLL